MTRPVIYSYPGQVPDSLKIYDIISMHYPDWKGNLNQYGVSTTKFGSKEMPMLFDEWAHVACYNNFELREDPNVCNFWGQGLDSMWTNTFKSDGGLGGAIWCLIGEVDLTVKPEMKYREKPQHDWEMDTKGFYYFGLDAQLPYTNIVRSLKENINSFSLKTDIAKIKVYSNGKQACRFDKINETNTLIINDTWDYNSLLWGNYMKQVKAEPEMNGQVTFVVD